jgi:hypothetical protein
MTLPEQTPDADGPRPADLAPKQVADDDQVKGGVILYSGHAGLGANVVAPPPKGTTGST